ncbi:MAG: hypothetical protein M1326_03870, partial [Cyanobacteria bacterium]|nr:hypothetical protein [Cyanobacteriota bacterium]
IKITYFISPQQDKAFYLKQIGGKTIGYIFNFKTLNQSQVWESDYNDWLITWPTDNLIALQTKTSGQVPSNLYFLNPSNGSVIKILSNINGLSSLVSPDGNLILYSLTYNNNPYLYLLDLKAKTNLRLKVKTLANKCLWENDNSLIYCAVPQTLPAANYPDDWYQGKLIFNDEIWSINPSTKETTRIFNFNTINKSFDIDKLLKDQNNLFYLHDKKTGQIWTFDLSAD